MRDVTVFRKPMGGESYVSTGIPALRPVVLVRSLAMGGKAAVGGGLVLGLLVGAAIVAGVVVLTPGPVAPTAPPTPAPVTEASAPPVPSASSLPVPSVLPSPSSSSGASPEASDAASPTASIPEALSGAGRGRAAARGASPRAG